MAPKNVFHQFIHPLRPLNSGQPSHQSKCLWPRVSTLTLFWALTISTGIGGWVDTPAPHVAEWQGEFEMPSSLWREKSTSFSKILEKTLCMAESRFLIYLLFMFTIKSNKNLQVFRYRVLNPSYGLEVLYLTTQSVSPWSHPIWRRGILVM